MLTEKSLLKIGLASSLVGLVILFFITNNMYSSNLLSKEENLNNFNEENLIGEVTNIQEYNKSTTISIRFFDAKDNKVILFRDKNSNFSIGDYVEVNGEEVIYNNKSELIAEKVTLLR